MKAWKWKQFLLSRELTRCGVKAILPVAGYYIFPDFEILRPVLEARGILTCEQMCEALFKEADVVVSYDVFTYSKLRLSQHSRDSRNFDDLRECRVVIYVVITPTYK